ncbi:MAG: carboxypeptidase-like regulatory domain-containing protein [Vicinamibacterales bacterium]
MRPLRTAITVLALAVCTASHGLAQTQRGTVTGRVTDGSGGALPGTTVTFQAGDPRAVPVATVTDEVGQYLSPPLPPGTYAVTVELSGFAPDARRGVVVREGDVIVLEHSLTVAAVTESVEVVATAPVAPPPVPPLTLEPPVAPKVVPVPKELLASVCGPGRPVDSPLSIGRLLAARDEPRRSIFGNGDVLVLDVGTDIGLVPGQNLVVRRRFRIGDKSLSLAHAEFGEQTAGLVQVVETSPLTSIAVVVYTCGELFAGDAVEPFDALPVLTAAATGAPRYDDPAHIVLGEHGQTLGAARQLMVIDRGTAQGAARGQRLTVFRRALGDRGPVQAIADAVIVAVRPDSATIRIERTRDAVSVGDYVALHR